MLLAYAVNKVFKFGVLLDKVVGLLGLLEQLNLVGARLLRRGKQGAIQKTEAEEAENKVPLA